MKTHLLEPSANKTQIIGVIGLKIACLAMVLLVTREKATAQTLATMINPANAATGVDPGAAFQWNAVSDAQNYYVWAGSQRGLKDIYESGTLSTSSTSITPHGLQPNTTYFLRMWTQINGCWCSNYVDTSFTTGYGTAHLTNPMNGMTNADPYAPFTWNAVPTAQSYTLNVGTTVGGKNIFSSGAILATSVNVPNLQPHTTYYATLLTQFSSGTLSSSSSFTTGTGMAHLKVPADGAVNVVPGSVFSWNSVSDAQVYDLYIGTSVGAQDVWVSNTITTTSASPVGLVVGKLYYARMWTQKAGTWYHVDTTFTTGFGTARLINPVNAATNVDPFAAFTWTTVSSAQSYTLWIGTSIGASDVYNSGAVNSTSLNVPGLSQNTSYHARLITNTSAGSTFVDTTFTTGLGMAHLINPAPNASNVDPFQPFSWNSVPGAQVYFIYVGTSVGASDIEYSGNIAPTATSQVIPGLLGGKTYYIKMWTYINNTWNAVNTVFTTATQPLPSDPNAFRKAVQQTNASVRLMTQGVSNNPLANTALAAEVASRGKTQADCTDYARTQEQLLIGQRISVRETTLTFDGTSFEAHDTTEYWDPFLNKWITTDATFGIVYWNPNANTGLSIADMSAAAAAKNWASVQPYILYVTNNGEIYAHNYYMDAILLYLNPLPNGQSTLNPLPNSPAPYFAVHTTADVGKSGNWLFSFANQTDNVVISDPVKGTMTLTPLQGTIYSQAVNLTTGWKITSAPSGLQILTMNRYLFF